MTNEGIDWKALSHAVRVAGQAIELLETGNITFPRPEATLLLRIKLGELPYATYVAPLLEDLVEEVEEASQKSKLLEQSDAEIMDALVRKHYKAQTQ